MRPRELIICQKKSKNHLKNTKSCGFVQGWAGNVHSPACKGCYANTFLNKHFALEVPKCLNCMSVFALSIVWEKNAEASIYHNSKTILQGLPLQGPSTKSQGWLLPGWPQEAVREPGRALPAQAELWSQLTASPERWASTKKPNPLFPQCQINYVQDHRCIKFPSDVFSLYWPTKFIKRSA